MEVILLRKTHLHQERCTSLFAKMRTSLFANCSTFLFAKKRTLLFAVYNNYKRSQHSITLKSLENLTKPVTYSGLFEEIKIKHLKNQ